MTTEGAPTTYRAIICDLDGVVYRGSSPVPYAVEALVGVRAQVHYATNNASRPPGEVAAHLRDLGLPCADSEVTTSSEAGAWLLSRGSAPPQRVLAVGGPGVAIALERAGFTVVLPRDAQHTPAVDAVLQGYGRDVTAADLAEAAYAVQAGACWVATNTDSTLPTDRGVAPGGGSLVSAVAGAVGRGPDAVAGKPHPTIYELALERLSLTAGEVLAIGDRLETDIEGALATGMASLFVLTGVDSLEDVLRAEPRMRPTYIRADLADLATQLTHEALDGPLTGVVRRAWGQLDDARAAGASSAQFETALTQAIEAARRVLDGDTAR